MLITKAQMIEAVMTEPLGHMYWYLPSKEGCTVCAVGAVLRHAGIAEKAIAEVADWATANHAVEGRDYRVLSCGKVCTATEIEEFARTEALYRLPDTLSALSWFHESRYNSKLVDDSPESLAEHRLKLADFITQHLPTQIEIDLNKFEDENEDEDGDLD